MSTNSESRFEALLIFYDKNVRILKTLADNHPKDRYRNGFNQALLDTMESQVRQLRYMKLAFGELPCEEPCDDGTCPPC